MRLCVVRVQHTLSRESMGRRSKLPAPLQADECVTAAQRGSALAEVLNKLWHVIDARFAVMQCRYSVAGCLNSGFKSGQVETLRHAAVAGPVPRWMQLMHIDWIHFSVGI